MFGLSLVSLLVVFVATIFLMPKAEVLKAIVIESGVFA
jgi:hypothetical protein